ncbi:hypothetical protein D3C79_846370 [compost metagenome]
MAGAGVEQHVELAVRALESQLGVFTKLARHEDLFVVADHIEGYTGRAATVGKAAGAFDLLAIDRLAFAHRVVGQGRAGSAEQQ